MHITICAIGRMRDGPHLDLFNTYQKRFNQNARQIGFKNLNLVEVEDKNKNDLNMKKKKNFENNETIFKIKKNKFIEML